jgi:hypothetical protein
MCSGLRSVFVALALAALSIGFVAAGEEKVPLDKLPKEVVKAVTSRFPQARMESAVKSTAGGKTKYEVTMKAGKFGIDITVTSEGKIEQIEKECVSGISMAFHAFVRACLPTCVLGGFSTESERCRSASATRFVCHRPASTGL